ncbi:prostate and testis expressed protein 4-like [Peromyscus maniculatus bairdii]|uniref:prostate and testis expressed protein 4-like n=1 Tax=Peromyscus maniculatus bairdii TaxID=230844 RepID=UPI003FD02E87
MTKVTKIIILLIVTISLLCSVEALKCVDCLEIPFIKSCPSQKETCEAKLGQKCLLTTLFVGKLKISIQKCVDHCVNATLNSSITQYACCNSHSLCNRL